MKKIIFLVSICIFFGYTNSYAIDLHIATSPTNSCEGANVDRVYYIENDSYSRYLGDEYWSSNQRAISSYQSKVTIWQSDNSLLSGCTTSDSWKMASNISPGNNERVIAFGANCTFAKPTDKNKRTLQFVYNVGNYEIGTLGGIDLGNFTFKYHNTLQDIADINTKTITINNAHLINRDVHDNECFNVELRYCGDGIITNGETCDPEAPGFDETSCSVNTCTPISTPTPKITVDKTDANPNDLDANEDDSQTVNIGDTAVFKITVINSGDEDLKNVVLTDPVSPSCDRTSAQTVPLIKAIGNNDDILNIGESFSYICEKSNAQNNYINTIFVTGEGVTSGITVNDDDTTNVLVLPEPDEYDLALRKTLSSNTPGPFVSGDEVSFDIKVFNQGNVDANNIEVTDYIPTGLTLVDSDWIQSGNTANQIISSIPAGETRTITINFIINNDVTGEIKNYAEISSDDGDDCDSTPDDINENQTGETLGDGLIDDAIGSGCNPGGDEDDHDIEIIAVEAPKPDVYLIKSLALGQESLVNIGDTVNYVITVYNSGSIIAENQRIEDHFREASDGGLALVPSTDWIETNGIAEYKELVDIPASGSISFDISFIITESATGEVRNNAVVCNEEQQDCIPVEPPVCDDETELGTPDGCVVVEIEEYDLALRKTVTSTGPYNTGDSVTFEIRVFNQGTIDSGEVEVIDYMPNGLTLNDNTWTISGSSAVRTISNIPAGGNTPLNITFTIDDDAPKNINNFAEISNDSGDDCDSIPDVINGGSETGETTDLVDDAIGTNCEEGGDEDDHDIAPIIVENGEDIIPSCDNLTASPNSASGDSLTTTLTCSGTESDIYKIEVRDEAGNIINTINASTGTITLNRGATSITNYTAKCFVNNTVTSNSCEQSLQITNGGGGSVARCLDIIKTSSNVYQCVGNNNANSISMRCGTDADTGNIIYLPTKAGILGSDDRRTASFTCDAEVPKCIVRKVPEAATPINENNWIDSASCQYSAGFCGDGVVDPLTETCDAGVNNGQAGYACTAQCTIPGGGSSSGGSSSGGGSSSSGGGSNQNCDPNKKTCKISTTPGGGEIIFGPFGGTVVGHAKNILENIPQFPFIQNTSEYDYSFAELCVKKTSGDNSVGREQEEICVNMRNKMLYGYEKLFIAKHKDRNYFEAVSGGSLATGEYEYPDFISNKDRIPVNRDYGEATLTTTIKDDIDRNGTLDNLYNAYFAAKLDVRVSKPSIATIGGGVSYVKNGSETTGDIRKVTEGMSDFAENTNFVGVSVSDSGVSSSVETNTDIGVIEDNQTKTDKFKEDINDVVVVDSIATENVSGFDEFENFNALDNVYIIRDKNITLKELPTDVGTPTTYIVEGGNLTLTKDIITNENIAFVVKGGNIIIEEDVEQLSGTYISIPVADTGGKIISEFSQKQLVVYGSLLGNITELVSNRYYIEKTGNQLSVGTIVSFGSKLLSKPAPLVAQFKSEYNASQKVAR